MSITRKVVIFGDEARAKLVKGALVVARAVTSTLGSKGRNVAIEKVYSTPLVVHDGVTVAREIALVDQFENMGAELIKEASQRTNDVAGDGTTTSMAIAITILEEGMRLVTSGSNPQELKKELDLAKEEVISQLMDMAQPVKNEEEIYNVAKVSSDSDEIARIVTDAINTIGKDGKLTVEEGGLETVVEYKDGLEVDGGYFTSQFITDSRRMEAEVSDCYVFITDEEITSHVDLLPFLRDTQIGTVKSKLESTNIVFVSPNIERSALGLLVTNHFQGHIKAIAVKGSKKRDILEDLCELTGATLIGRGSGISFQDATAEHLGQAKKVMATKDKSVFIAEKSDRLNKRIEQLENEAKAQKNAILQERLENRVARLKGGIAVISVGAASEVEMKEKVERVKDAVGATMSALEMGIVPGGGTALLRCKCKSKLLSKALEAPLFILAQNAGKKADYIVERVRHSKKGYNTSTDKFENLLKAGIIDPVKVTIAALRNAVSVSGMIITTDTCISEAPEEAFQTARRSP